MNNEHKFITPVSMIVTEEQYLRDLKEPLKKLGYDIAVENDRGDLLLFTNGNGTHSYGCLNSLTAVKRANNRFFIKHYNPKLFLALAAMTEGEDWIVGEYVYFKGYADTPKGAIFKCLHLNGCNNYAGYAGLENKHMYRKATKGELIEFMTKDTFVLPEKWLVRIDSKNKGVLRRWVEKQLNYDDDYSLNVGQSVTNIYTDNSYQNWNTISDDKDLELEINAKFITFEQFTKHVLKEDIMSNKTDRFPFKLDLEGARKITAVACSDWKPKLTKAFQGLVLEDTIDITEKFYKSMRDACSESQHEVLDSVFGKQESHPEDGTPCLVGFDEKDTALAFRYADGNGRFYTHGNKSGDTTQYGYQIVLEGNTSLKVTNNK